MQIKKDPFCIPTNMTRCIDGSEKSAATDLPFGEGGYSKVLLDAPCSSERHIIHAHVKANASGQIAEEMSNWKSSHSKTLAKTQIALLLTAVKAVKIGGSVLYATCSISQEENDDVVDRLLETLKRDRKKSPSARAGWKIKVDTSFKDKVQARAVLEHMIETTKHGRIALPDHVAGGRWGPLYFCVIKKVPHEHDSRVTPKETPDEV
jgi:16S rRNA C967 or C1407 C5-methylase (RsmB/RsmF family)